MKNEKEYPDLLILAPIFSDYLIKREKSVLKEEEVNYKSVEKRTTTPSSISRTMESYYHPYRWKNGSKFSPSSCTTNSHMLYSRLSRLHQQISSQENQLDSKTVHRNLDLASRLQQWFPIAILDEAILELHKTDLTKVVSTKNALVRILAYIECVLRIRCRTIPWKTLDEISQEFGIHIEKNAIAKMKFQAIKNGVFSEFFRENSIKESFDVVRAQIAMKIPHLPVNPVEKKAILNLAKKVCDFLEKKRQIPKDPEIYGYAIVEIVYKHVTSKRALVTVYDRRMKKQVSTAIHYIRKKLSNNKPQDFKSKSQD
ncbi:MAG: hypothetical protein ACFFDT_18925 [Candidatus Hodarchaeota archaeon]